MTIIGYDDNKYGGSFEIMNSWGTDRGENGFYWVPYKRLIDLLNEWSYYRDGKVAEAFILEYDDSLYRNLNPKKYQIQ